MKNLDEFLEKVNFYRVEARNGIYHNPYDVENELLDILRNIKFASVEEKQEKEDLAHDTGLLFWDM